jgi:hypothetical protein
MNSWGYEDFLAYASEFSSLCWQIWSKGGKEYRIF